MLAGLRAGEVREDVHELTWWTPAAWKEAVAASPSVYDRKQPGRPRVGFDAEGGLLWHELVRR